MLPVAERPAPPLGGSVGGTPEADRPWTRVPLLVLGVLALGAGVWVGLARLGWSVGAVGSSLALLHGPLMVCGFLGTVIGLERAVALGRVWAYAGPALTGLGGASLVAGVGPGPFLIAVGSGALVAVFAALLRVQRERFLVVMALGALAWFGGNVVWLAGGSVLRAVPAWLGFLVLTIAGERLELSRVLLRGPSAERAFLWVVGGLAAALVAATVAPGPGWYLVGAALVALAAWLARYDVARHTVRRSGLTRYVAVCLLAGYVWLALGGALAAAYGLPAGGLVTDAVLHAVFVGFVFSMIFGHAPIIFPSVLGVPVAYRAGLYAPLALLHVSLGLRVAGDLGGLPTVRQWGGLLNAAAVVLFLVVVATTTVREARRSAARSA